MFCFAITLRSVHIIPMPDVLNFNPGTFDTYWTVDIEKSKSNRYVNESFVNVEETYTDILPLRTDNIIAKQNKPNTVACRTAVQKSVREIN